MIPFNQYPNYHGFYHGKEQLIWRPACKRHVAAAKAVVTRRENKMAEREK